MNAPMTKDGLWRAVLAEAEIAVSRANFMTWFRKTALVSMHNGTAIVSVPNEFSKEWLEAKYRRLLLKLLRTYSENVREVSFVVGKEDRGTVIEKPTDPYTTPLVLKAPQINRETSLNPRYTFSSFVVGSSNELVHAASSAVVKQLGTLYNPLFLWGGVGLGKTHLLHAIGNAVIEERPELKVRYVTSEKFIVDLVSALRSRTMDNFKERFRSHDVLLIDDVQFLAGKEKSQEELVHTFNDLYANGRQIVFSSDRPPKSIPALEERLRSRFEGGMIADIGIPDYETRLAILNTKCKEKSFEVDPNSLAYIASNIQKNIRELEGALNRIIAFSQIYNKTPDFKEVKKLLAAYLNTPYRKTTHQAILKSVADFYNITQNDLLKRSRKKEVVRPRQIAMYLLREETKSSFPEIGAKLGGRDHSTVIHAYEKIKKEEDGDETTKQEITLIKERLYQAFE